MAEEKFNYNELTMLGGPPTKTAVSQQQVEDTGFHLKDYVSDYATEKPDLVLSLGNSNKQPKAVSQSQPKPQIAEPSERIAWDTTPQQTQRSSSSSSSNITVNTKIKTIWAWTWIVIIVLSLIIVLVLSK
jgi:hypothetical protein